MAKILVIEDNDIMNSMLIQMLNTAGYETESATNGVNGLNLFFGKEFDCIVTDIVMPEKEGLETIMTIRSHNKKIPIIAISGGGKITPKNYLASAQILGADYTFEKPLDKELFLAAVRECLAGIPKINCNINKKDITS